jgi:hypothetical protein
LRVAGGLARVESAGSGVRCACALWQVAVCQGVQLQRGGGHWAGPA